MTNNSPADDARAIWQSQKATRPPVTPEQAQARLAAATRKFRRRGIAVTVGALVLVVVFAFILAERNSYIERVGMLLMFVGLGYLLSQVHQSWLGLGETRPAQAETGRTSMDFYRSELERRRDFHRGRIFWSRYVMFIPGYLIFFFGIAWAHPHDVEPRVTFAFALVISIAAIPLNLGGARRVQKQIDELNRLHEEDA